MAKERIDKLLAHEGFGSRKDIRKLLRGCEVLVNEWRSCRCSAGRSPDRAADYTCDNRQEQQPHHAGAFVSIIKFHIHTHPFIQKDMQTGYEKLLGKFVSSAGAAFAAVLYSIGKLTLIESVKACKSSTSGR